LKLILLPGMDGTGALFADFIKALPDTVEPEVIAYPENEALSYRQLEALVTGKLPHGDDYVLLGESFSGPIGLSIAAKSPVGLRGLILCCTFAKSPRPLLARLGGLLPVSAVPERLRNTMLLGESGKSAAALSLSQVLQHIPDSVLKHRIHEVSVSNVDTLLGMIEMPVLYLRATQDRLIPRKTADMMIGKIKTGAVIDIKGPHMLLQANPSDTSESVLSFLNDL
jgi:pimeloyl-ACP methyl ester carboxylesterase